MILIIHLVRCVRDFKIAQEGHKFTKCQNAFESFSPYVMFIRSTRIQEFPLKESQHQFTFTGSLRAAESRRQIEKTASEKKKSVWVG